MPHNSFLQDKSQEEIGGGQVVYWPGGGAQATNTVVVYDSAKNSVAVTGRPSHRPADAADVCPLCRQPVYGFADAATTHRTQEVRMLRDFPSRPLSLTLDPKRAVFGGYPRPACDDDPASITTEQGLREPELLQAPGRDVELAERGRPRTRAPC